MILKELKSPNHQFTWVDITGPTVEDLSEVSNRYHLHHHHLHDCLEPDHLPKFEEGEDYQFIILRKMLDGVERGITVHALTTKIAIFYNDSMVVSIHRLPQDEIYSVCEQAIRAGKIATVGQLLLRIIARVQQSYDVYATQLNNNIDDTEAKLFIRKTEAQSIESLYLLKRRASLCKKLLLLSGEVILSVSHRQKKSNELQDIRDTQAKLQLFYDQLSDDAQNLVSTYMSFSAHKTNDVMKILTIFSAYFLPLTFIVGVYGMNFRFMPELDWEWGYPAVLVLMLVVFLAIYIWFRRKKWL
jgi:magnesium transporter